MRRYERAIFFLLDGSRPDVLGELLAQKKLPNFYELFVKNGIFTRATTVFPSTTGAAYLPYLTGFYPGHCNVPGIRWFDRARYAKTGIWNLQGFRSYIGPGSYFFNRDISENIKTLFDLIPNSMNIFSTVNRGVGFWGDRTWLFRSLYALYGHFTDRWLFVDRCIGRRVRGALRKNPRFLFSAFPAIDELSHRFHPFSPEVISAYLQFDGELGKILYRMEKNKLLDQTLFILASDHGMTATHTHFDLVSFMEGEGYRTFYYPKIFKRNFNLAIMQSGNAMAHIYLKKGFDWERKNYRNDLESLIDPLVQRTEVGWVAGLTEEGEIYVRSRESEAWIKEENNQIFYRTAGGDPLEFKNLKNVMTDYESLEFSFDQKYPDAFRQLLQLFKSERTGDLVVNAAPGYDLRLDYERPEHFSSHGSLIREHMQVPIAISHPIVLNRKIRSVDLFSTILELLDIETEIRCDGVSLFKSSQSF